ncbi:ARH1 [Candida pseudojiufengensis]|uniref:ARH1 n=1 Tax=Candida pseudojiufengensis TaxID=497109 RepID=UPI002224AF27|nr:ARH1 [Candida pseudojiufengensis]KAI5962133.1 ARH1 [Candida pseudojiufengensis]
MRLFTITRCFSITSRLQATPFKIAIIGTGPGGFYTGHHLLNKSSSDKQIHLDFFEKLPTPFGLSRYGVAPDHPEVKNCESFMNDLMKDHGPQSNSKNRVRFLGNIEIGKDLSLKDLEEHYNSIVLAYGCTASDNKLKIPGSDLPGVISARQFVNWYNGHPDCYEKGNEYVPPALDKIKDVTIIGNGNVALDVARILLAQPKKHWYPTDISVEAEKLLTKSSVKNVNIVARRGILASAFSNKEIRELFELKDAKFKPIEEGLLESVSTQNLGRVDKRRIGLLEKYNKPIKSLTPEDRTWSLQYYKSPVEFIANEEGNISETKCVVNKPINDPLLPGRVEATDEYVSIKNDLVILSIGYQGTPIKGFEDIGICFKNNKLHNQHGRVLSTITEDQNDVNKTFKRGWYTSGWIKNGPKGVIAVTMMDSFDTGDKILEDLSNGIHLEIDPNKDVLDKLKDKDIVYWDNWENLNKYELKKGEEMGKSRFKVCEKDKMLDICK